MQSDWLNILGALLITCAALASHPMSNAQADRLGDRFVFDWNTVSQLQGCADLGTGACYFNRYSQAQF